MMDALAARASEVAQHCCPTCGAELHDQVVWDFERRVFVGGGVAVQLTNLQAKIVNAVWRMRFLGGVQNIEQFMAFVYGDRPDGGPELSSVISVHLAAVRKRLIPTGYTITRNEGSPRRGWRIVKIADSA